MSSSSPSLRTPTLALPVKLALRGESLTSATLFVPDVPRQARAQLLEDVRLLLEQERDFLPVDLDGARTLVSRAVISYVSVARRPSGLVTSFGDDEVSDVHTLFDHRCPVLVTLVDAKTLRGTLLFSSSADRARLMDFINLGPRFLSLWRTDDLLLVQRSAIRSIIEVAEG
ncbi:MAG: hypothetical protein IPI49_24690 [Myxococcales bacterium]|nr:hypothetical protein [Myxococcales bacterium]